ncbi:MAG: LemA family protein [bacterium]
MAALISLGVTVGVLVIVGLFVMSIYNNLVSLDQEVQNAWSQIDVQLKRRHDLIPNLVDTAKGYMEHEQETLQKVTEARQQAVNASSVQEQAQAEGELSGALSRLMAVSEDYPDLKANENMMELQQELEDTENKISTVRQKYNDHVMQLNEAIQKFPNNMFAGMFGFEEAEFFEIEDPKEREAPDVEF